MADRFSGSEVIELGVQIEVNGMDFYSDAAKNISDAKVKDTFNFLAGEERRHIEVFRKLLETVESYEPRESYPEEYFQYMNALASNHVFTQKGKGREIAKAVKDERQALDMAMGFENDSMLFYEAMKKIVNTAEHPLLEELIRQEKGHYRMLSEIKKRI